MKKPRLILHIGQHKTGSKALQAFLSCHRDALRNQGVLYPELPGTQGGIAAYRISHYRLYALLRREIMVTCGNLLAANIYWAQQRSFCHPFESLRQFFDCCVKECRRHGSTTMILSAEDLFDMSTAHELDFSLEYVRHGANILKSLTGEFECELSVVVYLRRQDHLLCSHYGQFIKGCENHDIELTEFTRKFAPRLKNHDILTQWSSVFGSERLQVRPYESCQLPKGIIPDFFQHILGFPVPEHWAPPPEEVETSNISLSRDHIEFLRLLNRYRNISHFIQRASVLQAAVDDQKRSGHKANTAEWMSPKERRILLEYHAAGNAAIAAQFAPDGKAQFFLEELPKDDLEWFRYNGLSVAKILAILHRTMACKSSRSR